MFKRSRLVRFTCCLVLFVASFVVSFSLARPAAAYLGEYSPAYRWNSATMKVQNVDTHFQTAIEAAIFDFNTTDLSVTEFPDYYTSNLVRYQEVYWYGQPTVARSSPYHIESGGLLKLCVDSNGATNNCNTTDRRASYGEIQLNTYHLSFLNSHPYWIMKHELGHQLGMPHATACADITIMEMSVCGRYRTALQVLDINWINSRY